MCRKLTQYDNKDIHAETQSGKRCKKKKRERDKQTYLVQLVKMMQPGVRQEM